MKINIKKFIGSKKDLIKIKEYIESKKKLIKSYNIKKLKRKKVVILFISIFIFLSLQIHNVSAFDYPEKSSNPYVQDNANIFTEETRRNLFELGKKMKEEKNIQISFATINAEVGDKEVYTEKLKEWWNIGEDTSSVFIVIYPNSKDTYGVIVDSALKDYINDTNTKKYKKAIADGVENNNINMEITEIVTDISSKLKECTKQDTFFISIKDSINNIIDDAKVRKNSNVFERLFDIVVIRKLE